MKGLTAFHAIEGELLRNPRGARLFWSKKNKRIAALLRLAEKAGVPVEKISFAEIEAKASAAGTTGELKGLLLMVPARREESSGETGLGAKAAPAGGAPERSYATLKEFLAAPPRENALVLLLDGITDPHNLGALLRSADLFSVDLVIHPGRRSAGVNDTVARVSVGASSWVPTLEVTNLRRTMEELQKAGFWLYGADMAGTAADKVDLKGKTGLVLGSEGKGMSRLVQEGCDGIISIPIQGHVDSLNVSVAGGILLYEAARQRGFVSLS